MGELLMGDIDEINVILPSGRHSTAIRRADIKMPHVFESRLEQLRYFQLKRDDAGHLYVDDATEEVLAEMVARLKASKGRAKANGKERAARLRATARVPKPGSPTPERRKRAAAEGMPIERVAGPEREGKASTQAMVYHAPDNMARLHRNGTITSNMLHAASRFHADWIRAGMVGLRAAKLERLPRGTGGIDGQTEAALDARNRVHRICDRLGGFRQPGFQVLMCVVAEGATLAAWALKERSGPWRLDPNKAAGVLLSALGVLEGFYRPHPEAPKSAP